MRRWLSPIGRRLALTLGVIGVLTSHTAAPAAARTDAVILNPARYEILAGRYSPFAAFQTNLQRVLDQCGKGTPSVMPTGEDAAGRLGAATRYGIQRALDCPALRDVPADSPARNGIITDTVWHAVMGEAPAPSAEDRAHAMVLSFEATDFGDAPEWNLCQDGERRRRGQPGRRQRSRLLQRKRSLLVRDLGTPRRDSRRRTGDPARPLDGLEAGPRPAAEGLRD